MGGRTSREIDGLSARMGLDIMRLGIRENIPIESIIRRDSPSVDGKVSLIQAAKLLNESSRCVAVKEEGRIVGLISSNGLVKALGEKKHLAREAAAAQAVDGKTSLLEGIRIMVRERTDCLLVKEGNRVIGCVHLRDLLLLQPELIWEHAGLREMAELVARSRLEASTILVGKVREACLELLGKKKDGAAHGDLHEALERELGS